MTPTRIGVLAFALAVLLGPLYTVPGYSPVAHVISQLAAQNTPNNVVMAAAFVLLGATVAIDGLRARRREWLPFVAFGLAFGAAGLFGHRPIDPAVSYVAWMHEAHGVAATLSGIALTVGFAWQALRPGTRWRRGMAAGLALVCVGLPLLMLAQPSVQGAIQRLMYALVFAWLFAYYPPRAAA